MKHLSELCSGKCVIEMVICNLFSFLVGCTVCVDTAAQIRRYVVYQMLQSCAGVITKS